MMFQGDKLFDASFDVFAKNYHNVRPGYPPKMYEDIKEFCGIEKGSSLLEIGAGSGIATAKLAEFGCKIVGLEPGGNLAEIARKETTSYQNVEIVEKTFEEFESTEKFDAILALTAFHWIDKKSKYQKALDSLEDNGNLVLVWNSFMQGNSEVFQEINKVYSDFLPDVYNNGKNVNEAVLAKLESRVEELQASRLFLTFLLRRYLVAYNYDAETYPKLLNTFPNIIKLEADRREKFLAKISETVSKFGKVSLPILITLIICKKRNFVLNNVENK